MGWYATETLGDTYEETKGFLLPFDPRLWLKISVILFFVGGSYGSFPTGGTGGTGFEGSEDVTQGGLFDEVPTDDLTLEEVRSFLTETQTGRYILAFAIAFIIVLVFYTYLSAVFTFVYYRSIEDREVLLKAGFKRYAVDGFKLFLFNWLIGIVSLASVGALVYAFFFGPYSVGTVALVAVPIWILGWIFGFVVKNFVVPEMVTREAGFVEALRRSAGYVRDEWKQALVFAVTKFVLAIAASALVGAAFAISLLVLAIPFIIVGVVLYLISEILGAAVSLLFLLALLTAFFLITVPVQTYIFGWVLNVYEKFVGNVEPETPGPRGQGKRN